MRHPPAIFGRIAGAIAVAALGLALAGVGVFAPEPTDRPSPCASGSPDDRIAACTWAIEAGSNDGRAQARAFLGRAWAFADKGDLDRAIADLGEAIQRDPDQRVARISRGQLLFKKQDWDRAIDDFSAGIQMGGGVHAPDGDSWALTAFHDRGVCYRNTGDVDHAIEDLDEAIRRDPTSALSFANRGDAYRLKGNLKRALADFDTAIRLDPKNVQAYASRGGTLERSGDFARALDDLNTAIGLDPKYAYAYASRSMVYVSRGDLDQALADINLALAIRPDEPGFLTPRGGVYTKRGDFDRALVDLAEAIRRKPKLWEAYANRALLYMKKKQLESALSDLSAALEAGGPSTRLLGMRGHIYYLNGDAANAYADYRRASELEPENAYWALWEAMLARRVKADSRLARAAETIDKAAWPAPIVRLFLDQAKPDDILSAATSGEAGKTARQTCEANFFLGVWLRDRGDKSGASQRFQRAAQACPKNLTESAAATQELKELAVAN